MSHASPKNILISGATGAIGGALAEVYAARGVTLFLQGRDRERLDEVAARCRTAGAVVQAAVLDLRDLAALDAWMRKIMEHAEIDLVLPAAGVNASIGANGAGETWNAVEEILAVNIRAAMFMVNAVIPEMRRRGTGQIALFSSLAAYYGVPMNPGYCASKAAMKAYGESLRGWLGPEGIHVNVIMPGYIESRMCREMPGPKPFLWSPDRAARRIRRGLERNTPRISFPFPLNFGTWGLSALRPSIADWIVRHVGYRG